MDKIFKSLLIIALVSIAIPINAAKEEYSKTLQKEYTVHANTSLEVINKYGEVHIEDWDKQLIRIDVKITVDHNNKAEADALLKMINVTFSEIGDNVKAVTEIDEGFGNSRGWFGNHEGKKFRIDYQIKIPKAISLKLSNKYGNIFLSNLAGMLDIDLKYGNLNINSITRGDLKPMNQISVAYGKATIDQASWVKLNLSYSKASFQSCKALIAVSKYSKINLDKASSIVAESAYDDYSIGDLSNLVLTGKYSHYSFRSIAKKLDAEVKYSDINAESIPAGFESIKVENSYGKISLGIDPSASYELNAFVKYAGIRYPENNRVSRIAQNTQTTVRGPIGNGKSDSKVDINSSYGGVNLMK
jgi:hypothetical protein